MFWHQHKVASNAAVVCEIKIALQQFYLLSTQSHKYELKVNFYHSIVCAISVQCNCQLNWFILSTTMIHFNHQFLFCENEWVEKFQASSFKLRFKWKPKSRKFFWGSKNLHFVHLDWNKVRYFTEKYWFLSFFLSFLKSRDIVFNCWNLIWHTKNEKKEIRIKKRIDRK
jgi:hypothetical protein